MLRLNLALDHHPASLSRTKPSLVIPDEEAAAFKLLAQKFTGPRYFQPNASRTQPSHSGTAEPRISAADARLQVKRIAAERNLGPDVETKLNELKAPYTQEELQKQLQSKKLTLDDLKQQLRRDLSIQKLFNKEITSHISISDAEEVMAFRAASAASRCLSLIHWRAANATIRVS